MIKQYNLAEYQASEKNHKIKAEYTAFKNLLANGVFAEQVPLITPKLITKLLAHCNIDVLDKGASIGVIYSIEILPFLKHNGFTNVTLITNSYDPLRHGITSTYGYKYVDNILEKDVDMKFDVIVGNPPFSLAGNKNGKKGRAINLYPFFYEKSIGMSSHVAMIVPNTSRQHISFNKFIRANTNKVMYIDDSAFANVSIATWCLIKDCSDTNVDNLDWADLQEFPEQKVHWAKGKINVTTESFLLNDIPGEYTVYHKVNNKGLIKTTTNYNISNLKLFPSSGFAVIMPQQIQKTGWSKTAIVECNGKQAATNGVNIAFLDTLEEAEYLVSYMESDEFISQALANCGGMNNMTLTAMKKIDMYSYDF